MSRALCVGECMIEVRYLNAVTAGIGYAGDTYNTAVYLRRTADVLGTDVEVGYLTGLGDDEDSAAMRTAWAAEGVVDRSVRLDGLLPGLYTVRVDDRGERRFSYWRSSSAARHLFATTEWVEHLDGDVIHLSGITLQLASPAARAALRHRLADVAGRRHVDQPGHQLPGVRLVQPRRSRPGHGRGGRRPPAWSSRPSTTRRPCTGAAPCPRPRTGSSGWACRRSW